MDAIAASSAQVTNTATAVGLLADRLSAMESRMNTLSGKVDSRKCYHCGSADHSIATCPHNRNPDGSQIPPPAKK